LRGDHDSAAYLLFLLNPIDAASPSSIAVRQSHGFQLKLWPLSEWHLRRA
jgi:hypothetical protein